MKLNSECIPGRPGCVLYGKVKLSEPVKARLAELEEETKQMASQKVRSTAS